MFDLTPDELYNLLENRSMEGLLVLGGVEGLAKKLQTDLEHGLSTSQGSTAVDLSQQSGGSAIASSTSKLKKTSTPDLTHGHSPVFAERIQVYGTNELPPPKSKSFLIFCWETLHDKILILLSVAAAVEIAFGIYKSVKSNNNIALIDGFAILFAVLLVVVVTAGNDFRKQYQFRLLNSYSKGLNQSKVTRDGQSVQVLTSKLLVGDILTLSIGDIIPADGILISGFNLKCDESSLTGESDAVKKNTEKNPFLLSGTKIVDGMGKAIIIGTGVHSMNGRTLMELSTESDETPLQKKLSDLAEVIAKFGISASLGMLVVLLVIYFSVKTDRNSEDMGEQVMSVIISAITLIVVAVPEGLPLAVTLALAHATLRMLKDNNLVRHLSACETMGNATTICSDKTGTLTQNRMTVVRGLVCEKYFQLSDIPNLKGTMGDTLSALLKLVGTAININSSAEEVENDNGVKEFIGSKTEVALVEFTRKTGSDYHTERTSIPIVSVYPFSSERKRMSTVVKAEGLSSNSFITGHPEFTGQNVLFSKGASEIILSGCKRYVNQQGQIAALDDAFRKSVEARINEFANDALRTICVAFKPVSPVQPEPTDSVNPENGAEKSKEEDDLKDLILLGLFGIQDPLRDEVPQAVIRCQKAGVVVRMVTGDNLATARSIAKQCGILHDDGVILEGPVFRRLPPAEMDEIAPRLQVLARSSPQDKQILVNCLRNLGETVAVTGDGTNDAPALKSADVGFSMGIAGTEVAKEASDIVLLDDNFVSLVRAIVWGRSVYDSVRKFLQFQLSVNVSAVVITVFTSLVSGITTENKVPYSALSAIQLLWVNLIMDTFAALALATDSPTDALLDRKPAKKSDPLISRGMAAQILGQAVYQIIVCFVLYGKADVIFGIPRGSAVDEETGIDYFTSTVVFNVFVLCQLFNEINSRSITNDLNIFRGVLKNYYFIVIFIGSAIAQAIIVQYGGIVFKIQQNGLDWKSWLICVAFGVGSLPVGALIRLVPWFYRETDPELEKQIEQEEMMIEAYELEKIVISDVERSQGRPLTSREKLQWQKAIQRTVLQLRTVGTFKSTSREAFTEGVRIGAQVAMLKQDPSLSDVLEGSSHELQEVKRPSSTRGEELWKIAASRVTKQASVVSAFRRYRKDESMMNLTVPSSSARLSRQHP